MHVKRLSQLALLSLCFTIFPVAAADAPVVQQDSLAQTIHVEAPSWSVIARDVENGRVIVEAQKLADEASAEILRVKLLRPEEMTFENTFGVLDRFDNDFLHYNKIVNQISYIKDASAIREVVDALAEMRVNFVRKLVADKELWQAMLTASKQPWVESLSGDKKYHIEKAIWNYRHAGADLDAPQQQRLFEILQELISLNNEFSKNVADANAAWKVLITDEEEIDGLPSSLKRAAAQAANEAYPEEEKEQWLISSANNGEYALYFCHSSEARKKVWNAIYDSLTQPPFDNRNLVKRILALRHELARLLGHAHYADMATSRYMTGSAEKALSFVDDLRDNILSIIAIDNMQLREGAISSVDEMVDDALPSLAPWDEKYHIMRSGIVAENKAERLLPAYLPVQGTIANMMTYLGELFSLRFEPLETVYYESPQESRDAKLTEVPHPDILAYEVFDTKNGERKGILYLDLMGRDNKRAGAWTGCLREVSSPEGALLIVTANLSSIKKDFNGIFSYGDLRILFHEMGHVLHIILGDSGLSKNSSSHSVWDFVETPSQAVERLVSSPDFLRRYAKHFVSGDPIPDSIIASVNEKMSSNTLRELLHTLTWSKIDLELHSDPERYLAGRSIEEYVDDIMRSEGLIDGEGPLSFQLYRLSHCMAGGYAAGFYSYPWSEVLAADIYSRFREEGADQKKVADELREKIFSKGSSAPAEELYRDFMGRDPSYDAFLDEME